jgi:hypothetical protein
MRQRPPADESGHAIVDFLDEHRLPHSPENYGFAHTYFEGADCGSAWKKDPGSGVIGVEKGPLIPVV